MNTQLQTRNAMTVPTVSGLWLPDDPSQDNELLTMGELSRTLKSRGIINRSDRTLYHWSKRGCMNYETNERVFLRSIKVGRICFSTVNWFRFFIRNHEIDGTVG